MFSYGTVDARYDVGCFAKMANNFNAFEFVGGQLKMLCKMWCNLILLLLLLLLLLLNVLQ